MSYPAPFDLITQGINRVTSFWQKKPTALGFVKSKLEVAQKAADLIASINSGRGIFECIGQQLDDIGYMFNISRQGQEDEQYRIAILARLSILNASGTTSDIIRFTKIISNATFVDVVKYPNIKSAVVHTNSAITEYQAKEITTAGHAGAYHDVIWDDTDTCFVPCYSVDTSEPEEILGVDDLGDISIGIVLVDGALGVLGFVTEDLEMHYPFGFDRSTLNSLVDDTGVLGTSTGFPIDVILPTGSYQIEVVVGRSEGGRILANSPALY